MCAKYLAADVGKSSLVPCDILADLLGSIVLDVVALRLYRYIERRGLSPRAGQSRNVRWTMYGCLREIGVSL